MYSSGNPDMTDTQTREKIFRLLQWGANDDDDDDDDSNEEDDEVDSI
jgi:hypothetical protein